MYLGTVSNIKAAVYEHVFQGECLSTGDVLLACHMRKTFKSLPVLAVDVNNKVGLKVRRQCSGLCCTSVLHLN